MPGFRNEVSKPRSVSGTWAALFALQQIRMTRNSPNSQGFVSPDYSSHQQQTTPEEPEFGSPPPYTSTTDHTTAAKGYGTCIQTCSLPLADIPTSVSCEESFSDNAPLNTSTSIAGSAQAYTQQPPMSATSADPWSKYDDTPGCCCSTTGGCCFSSRGGCCFSDTEGCCFSSTKGCCFSSNAACCFSGPSGSTCCSSKVRLLMINHPKLPPC